MALFQGLLGGMTPRNFRFLAEKVTVPCGLPFTVFIFHLWNKLSCDELACSQFKHLCQLVFVYLPAPILSHLFHQRFNLVPNQFQNAWFHLTEHLRRHPVNPSILRWLIHLCISTLEHKLFAFELLSTQLGLFKSLQNSIPIRKKWLMANLLSLQSGLEVRTAIDMRCLLIFGVVWRGCRHDNIRIDELRVRIRSCGSLSTTITTRHSCPVIFWRFTRDTVVARIKIGGICIIFAAFWILSITTVGFQNTGCVRVNTLVGLVGQKAAILSLMNF